MKINPKQKPNQIHDLFNREIVGRDVISAVAYPIIIGTVVTIRMEMLAGIVTIAATGALHYPNLAQHHATEMLRKTLLIEQKNMHLVNIRSSLENHLFGKSILKCQQQSALH